MSDQEIMALGREIEIVVGEMTRIWDADVPDSDGQIEAIQDAADYWNKRETALAKSPDTYAGLVEQARIAAITGLRGCDGWQDKIIDDLLRIGGADLSAEEANKLPRPTS